MITTSHCGQQQWSKCCIRHSPIPHPIRHTQLAWVRHVPPQPLGLENCILYVQGPQALAGPAMID